MASLIDLITDDAKNTLVQIIDKFNTECERRKFEFKKQVSFNNIYEVIEYLKAEGAVKFVYTYFFWDKESNETPIIWEHQISDGTDCVFWDVRENMSIEDFKEKFDKGIDEFGFLYGFEKPF